MKFDLTRFIILLFVSPAVALATIFIMSHLFVWEIHYRGTKLVRRGWKFEPHWKVNDRFYFIGVVETYHAESDGY